MNEERLNLEGSEQSFLRFLPNETPRAVVHIAHGLAEHAERYRPLAEALVAQGWAVYAPDHRGHGPTCPPESLGFFADKNGWSVVLGDLRKAIEIEKKAHPEVPLALFAHSMGSFFAQDYIAEFQGADLDAVVFSGTSGPPPPVAALGRGVARVEKLRQGPRGRSALIDSLAFGAYNKPFKPARTDFDWLSRDSEQVDAYVNDPLCGFKGTNQLWVDLLDGVSGLTKKDRLGRIPKSLPIYIFSGDKDPVGLNGEGIKQLEKLYRDAELSVTMRLYPEGRHEMLNEKNRSEVVSDLIEWLKPKLTKA